MYKKKMLKLSVGAALLLTIAYYFDIIINIRSIFSDIITFNTAILSFLVVFFTILLSIQSTELFNRIEIHFKGTKEKIFCQLKELLISSIFLFLYTLLLKISPNNLNKIIKLIGVFVLFFSLFWLCSGIYFIIKDMYDTIIRANDNNKITLEKEE